MSSNQRPAHQAFGVSTLEGIAQDAATRSLDDADIDSVNRVFGPMLQLALAYNDLPEAGTEKAFDNAPMIDPIIFRNDLASVKSAFERGFRSRIQSSGEPFTRDEIAVMQSIERADIAFSKSNRSVRHQWERALSNDDRKPNERTLFVSTMMKRFNGRDPERRESVTVTVSHRPF